MNVYKLMLVLAAPAVLAADPPPSGIVVTPLLSEAVTTAPGKRVSLVQLDVGPGASAAPHRHEGYLFVYVVSGAVRSQITGDASPVRYTAGQTFIERPGVEHTAFANASQTDPARVLVTWFADDAATLTQPLD